MNWAEWLLVVVFIELGVMAAALVYMLLLVTRARRALRDTREKARQWLKSGAGDAITPGKVGR
jgi:hypothetical protein